MSGKRNVFTGDGRHDSNTLDFDPNFPTGSLRGYRVFPDARYPRLDEARDTVEAEVALTVKPVWGLNLYQVTGQRGLRPAGVLY